MTTTTYVSADDDRRRALHPIDDEPALWRQSVAIEWREAPPIPDITEHEETQ